MTEQKLKEFIDTHATKTEVSENGFVVYTPIVAIPALVWKIGIIYIGQIGIQATIKHTSIARIDMLAVCEHFGINHLNFSEDDQ